MLEAIREEKMSRVENDWSQHNQMGFSSHKIKKKTNP